MMTMSTPTAPPAATEAFVYDHLGNRVTYTDKEGYPTTYAHNGLNQYTHVHRDLVWDLEEDYYPEHDANGNLSRDRYGYVYSYDYRNRLTQIAGELAFGYDALGRRVKKTDDDAGATTYFYYDPFGRVIAEYDKPDGGSAALARVFVYGNGIDEVLAMFTPYHAGDPADWDEFLDFCGVWLLDSGDPGYDDAFDVVDDNVIDLKDFAVLAASWDLPSSEESDWYYLHDALGSVVGVVGARFGRESDRQFILYDVYGQPDVLPANGNPYLFTGRRMDWVDDDQILYYLRARHYSPLTGRFLQTDPIGYADSMNLYEYVLSNPANYVDPWGLFGAVDIRMKHWLRARRERTQEDEAIKYVQRMQAEQSWEVLLQMASYVPEGYWKTGLSGEQCSSLCGWIDALTDTTNPLGKGTRFGPQYGQAEAYKTGQRVGTGTGLTLNAVITVAGVHGTVVGIQHLASSGGSVLQMGQLLTTDGALVNIVVVNGRAMLATAETVAAASTAAYGWKNSIDTVKRACNCECSGKNANPEQDKATGEGKSWTAAREEYWKKRAEEALEGEFSPENLARMRQGKAPLHDELRVPKELHHKIPQREGGPHSTDNLEEMWPWEHEAVDPYRWYKGPRPSGR